jgi:hypothetical protein
LIPKKAKFRKSTAYHEAGHAVAATVLELEVENVSIILDKARGTIDWESAGRVTIKDFDYGDRGVIFLLAGVTAQKKHAPTSVRRFTAEGDFDKAKMLIGIDAGLVDAIFKKRWNWLQDQTDRLVATQWRMIEAVASCLMETGELTGTEVSAIVCHCGGELWEFPENHHLYEPVS